jgi:hypothetical protein
VDGWGDGRAGLAKESTVRLNDSNLITDLRGLDTETLFTRLSQLGDESCQLLTQALQEPLARMPKTILVATHVPPFPEAALYATRPTQPDYAPHFVNLGLGTTLMEVAKTHPSIDFRVYCGHTHHRATYQPLANLRVEVAGSDYVAEVSDVLEV